MNGCVARKSADLQDSGQKLRLGSSKRRKLPGGGHCEALLLTSNGLGSQVWPYAPLVVGFSQLSGYLLTLKFDRCGGQMGQFSSSQ